MEASDRTAQNCLPGGIAVSSLVIWRFCAIDVELNKMRSAKYSQRMERRNLIEGNEKELMVANEEAICQHRCCT
jgi:hypothetical protein